MVLCFFCLSKCDFNWSFAKKLWALNRPLNKAMSVQSFAHKYPYIQISIANDFARLLQKSEYQINRPNINRKLIYVHVAMNGNCMFWKSFAPFWFDGRVNAYTQLYMLLFSVSHVYIVWWCACVKNKTHVNRKPFRWATVTKRNTQIKDAPRQQTTNHIKSNNHNHNGSSTW